MPKADHKEDMLIAFSRRGRFNHAYVERATTSKGRILDEWHFDSHRFLHREPAEGPALRLCYPSGKLYMSEYRWHGLLHRDDGPARVICFPNGVKAWEDWFRFGRYHRRDDKPAEIERNENGQIEQQLWWLHGYQYRDPRRGGRRKIRDEDVNRPVYDGIVSDATPPGPVATRRWLVETYGWSSGRRRLGLGVG
jgi:hypothetical protein